MKNKSNKKVDKEQQLSSVTQRIVREGTLILSFLAGLFLFIALISYSSTDPGFTTTGSGDEVWVQAHDGKLTNLSKMLGSDAAALGEFVGITMLIGNQFSLTVYI